MVLIHRSHSALRQMLKKISAVALVCAGFFAIFFAAAPRVSNTSSAIGGTAFADAPSCGGDSACSGDSAGGCASSDGSSSDGGAGAGCASSDGSCACDGAAAGAGCDGAGSAGAGAGGAGDGGSDSGGGGDSGGGKIICTEMFRQGKLRADWYEADERFGKIMPREVVVGYQFWARPIVRAMRRSRIATEAVSLLAKPWAQQMAYEMGVAEHGSRLGKFLMVVGIPTSGFIGNIIALCQTHKTSIQLG